MTSEPAGPQPDLSRAAELLWGDRQRPSRGPKPALSLDRIVREAIEVADAEGLPTLSMQRLATRLGAGTMSLYRYVPGKDELVSLMFDTALGQPCATSPEDWRGSLRSWAKESLEFFHRHPWALSVAGSSRVLGPNEMAWGEAALYALSGSNLSPAAMYNAVFLVNGYVRGAAQLSVGPAHGPTLAPEKILTPAHRNRFPTLSAILFAKERVDTAGSERDRDQPDVDRDHDEPAEIDFEFGLERVLDGLEHFIAARAAAG